MTALYAVSAAVNGRVANTCNLSEDWIGYSSKFGDSAGDFSPLSRLTVTEIKAIGNELGLPPEFVNKIPADGLSGLTDEENLGFSYDVLDRYIRTGLCENALIKERIDTLHIKNQHKIKPMPCFEFNYNTVAEPAIYAVCQNNCLHSINVLN
jgi:NAD+ synthase